MKKIALTVAIVVLIASPFASSALTNQEIQSQISALLLQISQLKAQLALLTQNQATTNTLTTPTSNSAAGATCYRFARTMQFGSKGDDVKILQQYLISLGLLQADAATGYYGRLTESAIQSWQFQQNIITGGSAALTGWGVFGPATQSAMLSWCLKKNTPTTQSTLPNCAQYQVPQCTSGQTLVQEIDATRGCKLTPRCVSGPAYCPIYNSCPAGHRTLESTDSRGCTVVRCETISSTNTLFSATPTNGTAPLSVTFSNVKGTSITFGDGSVSNIIDSTYEQTGGTVTHTYQNAGTYTATNEGRSVTITVTSPTVSSGGVLSASPASGPAPLTVTFSSQTISATYFGGIDIDYGDGQSRGLWCNPGSSCSPRSGTHTYTTPGTYTAQIIGNGEGSGGGVLGSATITVSSGTQTSTPAPSLSASIPQVFDYLDRGTNLTITWQSSNAPSGSKVYLSLVRADGSSGGGVIADHLAVNGSHTWTIPTAGQIYYAGYYKITGEDISDGKAYRLRAHLYTPSTGQCFEGCPPSAGTLLLSVDIGTITLGAASAIPSSVVSKYNELIPTYGQSVGISVARCVKGSDKKYIVKGSGGFTAVTHYYTGDGSFLGSVSYNDTPPYQNGTKPFDETQYQCTDVKKMEYGVTKI